MQGIQLREVDLRQCEFKVLLAVDTAPCVVVVVVVGISEGYYFDVVGL